MRFAQAIRTVPPIKCEAGFRRKRSSWAQLPPGSSPPSGQMRKALLVVADRPRHWLGRSAVVTHGSVRGIVGALGRRAFRSFAGMIPRGHNNNRMMYGSAIPGSGANRQRHHHCRHNSSYTNASITRACRRHLGLFCRGWFRCSPAWVAGNPISDRGPLASTRPRFQHCCGGHERSRSRYRRCQQEKEVSQPGQYDLA